MNNLRKHCDKYFLRSNEILKAEELNPWVCMQIFCRKQLDSPGKVAGIKETADLILNNSELEEVQGRIYAREEGDTWNPQDPHLDGENILMYIIAPIREIIELETVYLGVLSTAMHLENIGTEPDLLKMARQAYEVCALADPRPVFGFGARHWHYKDETLFARVLANSGVADFSTDAAAKVIYKTGIGTIPHVLENIFSWAYMRQKDYDENYQAVPETIRAFHKHMLPTVPRVSLVDYENTEIEDTIKSFNTLLEYDRSNHKLTSNLDGIRIDTCGENYMQGGWMHGPKYLAGRGVTASGVHAVKRAIDDHTERLGFGRDHIMITVSSGFSNPDKVNAFLDYEAQVGERIFHSIGAGFLDDIMCCTADVVLVGEDPETIFRVIEDSSNEKLNWDFYDLEVSKVGRDFIHTDKVRRIL